MIEQLLTKKNFELIREAIGSILAIEFANQLALHTAIVGPTTEQQRTTRILEGVTVWEERMVPLQDEEEFVIVPILFSGDFDNQSNFLADTTYQYYIDVYGKAKADKTAGTRADLNAATRLMRVLGMIWDILHHANYRTLGFPNNPNLVVRSRNITNFKRTEVEENETSVGVVMYRAILTVESCEANNETTPALNITELFSSVKVNETDKGFQWLVNIP